MVGAGRVVNQTLHARAFVFLSPFGTGCESQSRSPIFDHLAPHTPHSRPWLEDGGYRGFRRFGAAGSEDSDVLNMYTGCAVHKSLATYRSRAPSASAAG
jgi:hypothetical protein